MRLRGLALSSCALLAAFSSLAVVNGCVEDVDLGSFNEQATLGGSGGVAGGGGMVVAGGTAGAGGEAPLGCVVVTCLDHIFQCGDCLDNDGDGKIDSDDELCLGPCDNTEESFYGGIPGQNNSPCRQDCYFDQDTGAGNDDCYWSHECDPGSLPDDYPPSGDDRCVYDPAVTVSGTQATCAELELEQSLECSDVCGPLTPNGCDCFGCCELPAGSGSYVWLGSTSAGFGSCSDETLGDEEACRPCTPVPSCLNTCDACEVCVGKPVPAAGCSGESICGEYQACGLPEQAPCPPGNYCVTGCCIVVPK